MMSIRYLAVTGLLAVSVQASAGLLSISGGTSQAITGQANDFETVIGAASYNIGGNLYFGGDAYANANLTYTFLGREAGWESVFSAGGNSLSNRTSVGSSFSLSNIDTTANGGLLEFDFNVVAPDYAKLGAVANGDNAFPEPDMKSFAIILNSTFNGVAYDALLLWDDAGGNGGDDDNHDDQVIGLNISKVPEPGTLALMGLGLLGFGVSRRRNK